MLLDKLKTRELIEINHYIGGQFQIPSSGEYFDSENPYTGQVWARVARGNNDDANLAVDNASGASDSWASLKPSERGRFLYRLADEIERHAKELAQIEVRDNGKLYAEMFGQTRYIAEWYRYYAGLADKIEGSVIPTDKRNILNYTQYEPLGVVAMITPWNSPLLLLTWKLAPALAAGNVAVIKPSEFTSASTIAFMELIDAVGFPPGVVNTVTGYGPEIGMEIIKHPKVAKVAFTGSDYSGQKVYEQAASGIKHICLELGGKSPNIVFEDANIDAAIAGVLSGIFAASGQTCIAGSRLLLQKSIYDQFLERLIDVAGAARIGNPMLPETNVGPVATRPQFEKVLRYIKIAQAEGAQCVLGGGVYDGPGSVGGLMVQPTIFSNCRNDMIIAREEVFGPVLATIPFDTEDEAYDIANDSAYGLGAGIWTSDIGRAHEGASRIKAGTIWVNTYRALSYTSPFGGYKRSGIGREGGLKAIYEYLETKSVWICTKPSTADPFVMR